MFSQSHFPCRKKRISKICKTIKKTNKLRFKLVWLCCATCLDQFLQHNPGPAFNRTFFVCFGVFVAETTIFTVFSAKQVERHPQKQSTICEFNCTNCSFQNALFLCVFLLWSFLNFHFLESCVLIGSKNKCTIPKKNKQERKIKQDATSQKIISCV